MKRFLFLIGVVFLFTPILLYGQYNKGGSGLDVVSDTTNVPKSDGVHYQFNDELYYGIGLSLRKIYYKGLSPIFADSIAEYTSGHGVSFDFINVDSLKSRTVQLSNNEWLYSTDNAGTVSPITMWKVNTDNEIEAGANIKVFGSMRTTDDPGDVVWMYVPVTASAADNDTQSVIVSLDGSEVLEVGALADGSGGVDNKFIRVGGTISGNTVLRGKDTFTTSATSDTVVISGVTASSIFVISINDADPVADDLLSWTCTTDSLFVHRIAGTTSGLAYSYIRID